jgi:hypothetical protein
VALSPDLANNRLGSQSVRGGYTATVPMSDLGSLGGYREYDVSGASGAVITEVGIVGTNATYFYFDPNDSGAGGSGTITFTPPAGSGVPLSGGLPYLQSIPLTVTATAVRFSNTQFYVGRDLQDWIYLALDGPAPAGGLTVQVSSSSSNVLLSAASTTAGTQTLAVTIPAGSTSSNSLYVQNVGQSTGTAELTVQVLTDPNPGYGPGTPATVSLLASGFELFCSGTGCGYLGNNFTLDTSTQASPTLLYLQAVALSPDLANNRLGSQSVRGGYTATVPMSDLGSLGGYREYDVFGASGAVITEVGIVGGQYYAYFYFDPNENGAGGSGTITFTPPAGSGVPVSGGLPYLQEIPLTVTP